MKKITLTTFLFLLPFVFFGQVCNPVSTLDCADVEVSLPVNFDFSAGVTNTILDSNSLGTGFTAVLENSEARRAGDIPVSDPNMNGYEPSLLTLNSGVLEILSQGGIAFLDPPASNNNNNQINTLGVGFDNLSQTINIKTTLLNIVTGASAAQAGLWYGFDEDNFVKLNVNNDNIELRVESGGLSDECGSDQIQLNNLGASGSDVVLEMAIDPVGVDSPGILYYRQLASRTSLGTLAIPANYFTGRDINATGAQDNMSFAGIYATHRAGSVNSRRALKNLARRKLRHPTRHMLTSRTIRLQQRRLRGTLADYGREFGFSSVTIDATNYQYGWFQASNDSPLNATGNGGVGRNRIAGTYSWSTTSGSVRRYPGTFPGR